MALLDQFDGDVPEVLETETEPVRCIHCGEEKEVNWGHLTSLDGGPLRQVWCKVCHTSWDELYTIQSIVNIEIGDKL